MSILTGKEFNVKYSGRKLVKLTNLKSIHNNYKYQTGLNIDSLEFNEDCECKPGGFYCCFLEDMHNWIGYRDIRMEWIWEVSIPDNAKVVIGDKKIKVNSFYLSNKTELWSKNLSIYIFHINKWGFCVWAPCHAQKYITDLLKNSSSISTWVYD